MIIRSIALLLALVPTLALGQTLTWGTKGQTSDNLANPYSWSWDNEWRVGQQIFEPLVLKGTGDEFIPVLANNLDFSVPGEVRIVLKQGVQFHSGNQFNAEDVAFSFERAAGESSTVKHHASVFDSVDLISDHELKVSYLGSVDQAIFALSRIMMVDSQWHDDLGFTESGAKDGQVSGTGAFFLVSDDPGVRIILMRFSEYREQLEHAYEQVEIIAINDQSTALNAIRTGQLDFLDNVSFQMTLGVSDQSNLLVRQFSNDLYFVAEANTKTENTQSDSDDILLPHLQKTLQKVLATTDSGLSGYGVLNDVSASSNSQDIANLTPSDGFPQSVTVSCQYEFGFLGDVCQNLGSELRSDGVDSSLNFDRSRWDDAQLFVRWRRLSDLQLPDASYSSENDGRISIPLLADFRSVVTNTELEIAFGHAGIPLLSPYAAASDDDDGCDKCPPSGACSQSIILSRQECCPPSGACSQ